MIEVQAELTRGDFRFEADFVAHGGVSVLFGRSGSGKTTAADLIAGLLRPTRGRIVLNGEVVCDTQARLDLPAWRRRIGYVFQDARLFPHLNVRDNLLYGARRRGVQSPPVDEVIGLLGLEGRLMQRPNALSGGEAAALRLVLNSTAVSISALIASEVLARRASVRRGRP